MLLLPACTHSGGPALRPHLPNTEPPPPAWPLTCLALTCPRPPAVSVVVLEDPSQPPGSSGKAVYLKEPWLDLRGASWIKCDPLLCGPACLLAFCSTGGKPRLRYLAC